MIHDVTKYRNPPKLINKETLFEYEVTDDQKSFDSFVLQCKEKIELTKGQSIRVIVTTHERKLDRQKDYYYCRGCKHSVIGWQLNSMGICNHCMNK